MHVPILKQGGYLIASIQSVLSDSDLVQLRDNLGERVGTSVRAFKFGAHGLQKLGGQVGPLL